jgi:BirA family biotin operon repressor/biotin-[acetyl-CoA-carboxylase] ligase
LEILSFEEIDSTQRYLIDAIERRELSSPVVVIANEQTNGVGSRENEWCSARGDFLVSFALPLTFLPKDLPLASSSIYFAFIMKEILLEYNQKIWLKWPNDIYWVDKKVGGIVTKKIFDSIVCGVGINLKKSKEGFETLNIGLEATHLLQKYLFELEKKVSWKQIFMKYKLEFNHNKDITTHVLEEKINLKNAILCDDGSLLINKKRIYSLR